MIKQVSWTEYWTVLAVLCAVYYSIVIFLYYRKELFELLSGKRRLQPIAPPTSAPDRGLDERSKHRETNTTPEEKLFETTSKLMQELNPVFGKDYVKGELMTALQGILRKYSELKGTAFQVSVNNYIQMESENQSLVNLSEGELRGLWS